MLDWEFFRPSVKEKEIEHNNLKSKIPNNSCFSTINIFHCNENCILRNYVPALLLFMNIFRITVHGCALRKWFRFIVQLSCKCRSKNSLFLATFSCFSAVFSFCDLLIRHHIYLTSYLINLNIFPYLAFIRSFLLYVFNKKDCVAQCGPT